MLTVSSACVGAVIISYFNLGMTKPALTDNDLIFLIAFFDQDLRSYTTDGGKGALRFANTPYI
ncbi:hypothetical protein [Coleofasciculus chthonoplastes]|uniref:hypothetical protein n=1 Tax=Coleofasciculus chthonoplastes TaxID=64178 RepID=UPI0040643669